MLVFGAATPTDASSPFLTDDARRPARPSSPSDVAYYVTAQVQQEFDELDCTVPENRTGRVGEADEAFVTCDADPEQPYKYVLGPVEVDGTRLVKVSAGPVPEPGGQVGTRWAVRIEFDDKGTSQFAAATERLLDMPPPQNQFGIVLDGLVISAPSVDAVVPNGIARISGNFTRQSAEALAYQLRHR